MVDVLIADDDLPVRKLFAEELKSLCKLTSHKARNVDEALKLLSTNTYKLVLLNYNFGVPANSDKLLSFIKEENIAVDVFIFTNSFGTKLSQTRILSMLKNKQKVFPFVREIYSKGDLRSSHFRKYMVNEIQSQIQLGTTNPTTSEDNIQKMDNLVDIGLITVKQEEYSSILRLIHPDYNNRINTPGGDYPVAYVETLSGQVIKVGLIKTPFQGQTFALKTVEDLKKNLNPKFIFLVGIGGAGPSADVSLGDVVLATNFYDFCISAINDEGKTTFAQMGDRAHPKVLHLYQEIQSYEQLINGWNDEPCISVPRPSFDFRYVEYYGEDTVKKENMKYLHYHFSSTRNRPAKPIYKIGAVMTSNTLVKNTAWYSEWKDSGRNSLGIEMEIAGVYLGAENTNDGTRVPVVAIRGISDIVGIKRSSAWERYACDSAASFAYKVIQSGLVPLQD